MAGAIMTTPLSASVWPRNWLVTVQRANLGRVKLELTAHDLKERGFRQGTLRLEAI
jgi:hypothetical protein